MNGIGDSLFTRPTFSRLRSATRVSGPVVQVDIDRVKSKSWHERSSSDSTCKNKSARVDLAFQTP